MVAELKARQVLYGDSFRSTVYLAVVQKSKAKEGGLDYSVLEIISKVDLEAPKVDYDRITIDEGDHSVALCCYQYVPFDDTPNGRKAKVMRAVHVEIFPNHAVETIHIDASPDIKDQDASKNYFEEKGAE